MRIPIETKKEIMRLFETGAAGLALAAATIRANMSYMGGEEWNVKMTKPALTMFMACMATAVCLGSDEEAQENHAELFMLLLKAAHKSCEGKRCEAFEHSVEYYMRCIQSTGSELVEISSEEMAEVLGKQDEEAWEELFDE